jgi:hypothetical protein
MNTNKVRSGGWTTAQDGLHQWLLLLGGGGLRIPGCHSVDGSIHQLVIRPYDCYHRYGKADQTGDRQRSDRGIAVRSEQRENSRNQDWNREGWISP